MAFFTSNCCFWPNYESPIHNIVSSSDKAQKYVQYKHTFASKNSSKQIYERSKTVENISMNHLFLINT